jgi:hypothetical protein
MPADGMALPLKKGTSARPGMAALLSDYLSRASMRKRGNDRLWSIATLPEEFMSAMPPKAEIAAPTRMTLAS